MLEELGVGGQERANQFTAGFPIVGILAEPGTCPGPKLDPRQLLTNAKYRIKSRMESSTDPPDGQLKQVKTGYLGGPFPFDGVRNLATGGGPQLANPAFRFGGQRRKSTDGGPLRSCHPNVPGKGVVGKFGDGQS